MSTISNRIELQNIINDSLEQIEPETLTVYYNNNPLFHIDRILSKFYRNFTITDKLQSGAFGSVFESLIEGSLVALKIARAPKNPKDFENADFLTPNMTQFMLKLKEKNNIGSYTWREWFALFVVIKPIILKRECPNLPLLYNFYVTRNAILKDLEDFKEEGPASIYMLEYANSGMLIEWLKSKTQRSEQDYNIALFQIMAGLHALQLRQLVNKDVKNENILVYEIPKIEGTYFHYVINGVNYYIPNNGFIFIINDFGISDIYNPDFSIKSDKTQFGTYLGYRAVMVMVDKNNGSEPYYSYLDWKSYNMRIRAPEKREKIKNVKELIFFDKGTRTQTEIVGENTSKIMYGSDVVMNSSYSSNSTGGYFLPKEYNDSIKQKKYKINNEKVSVNFVKNSINQTTDVFPELKLTREQQDNLYYNNVQVIDCKSRNFYKNPLILPPSQIRIDTQDAIRMFSSDDEFEYSRVAQFGNHPKIDVTQNNRQSYDNFRTGLKKYIFEPGFQMKTDKVPTMGDKLKYKFNKPYMDMAGYFINEYFEKGIMFKNKPPNDKIIETYRIN
jgi:serine/threonine protein kinase